MSKPLGAKTKGWLLLSRSFLLLLVRPWILRLQRPGDTDDSYLNLWALLHVVCLRDGVGDHHSF